MLVQDMIDYLRLQVHIQDKNGAVEADEDYLALTDKDLRLFFNVVLSRDNWEYDLDEIPGELVYPLILLTKRELFMTLAVKVAPEYDLVADNNNQLKEDQKFRHYMELIKEIDNQYAEYLETSEGAGANTLQTFDVLLASRYYSKRYYDKSEAPALTIRIHRKSHDNVEVSWIAKNVNRLLDYRVYVSVEPVVDKFNNTVVISPKAREAIVITDAHKTCCRATGLASGTMYYLAVKVSECNGLYTIKETSFVTEER